jgi:hypothetical protein
MDEPLRTRHHEELLIVPLCPYGVLRSDLGTQLVKFNGRCFVPKIHRHLRKLVTSPGAWDRLSAFLNLPHVPLCAVQALRRMRLLCSPISKRCESPKKQVGVMPRVAS